VLAAPLGTALGGPLTAWLGAQHTLLASAAATVATGLASTAIIILRRRTAPGDTSLGPGKVGRPL
jgi:predicted MFS family arabinose efflux permease